MNKLPDLPHFHIETNKRNIIGKNFVVYNLYNSVIRGFYPMIQVPNRINLWECQNFLDKTDVFNFLHNENSWRFYESVQYDLNDFIDRAGWIIFIENSRTIKDRYFPQLK